MADDLAYSCVDTAGAASTSTLALNRLLRTRQDSPPQLKDLQAQTTASKETLEKLLSMIDCDTPSFQTEAEVTDLNAHLDALLDIFREIQEHAAKVSRASRSVEKATWTMVWPVAKITTSEEALKEKLNILGEYIDGTRRPTTTDTAATTTTAQIETNPAGATTTEEANIEATASARAQEKQPLSTSQSTTGPIVQVSGPSQATPSSPAQLHMSAEEEKEVLRLRDLGETATRLGSTPGPSTADHGEPSVPMSAIDSPPEYEETASPFHQVQVHHRQDSEQSASNRMQSPPVQTTVSPPPVQQNQPQPPQQMQMQRQMPTQMQMTQRLLANTQTLQRNVTPAVTPAMETMKAAMGMNRLSMLSARKMKSSLMLTKSLSFGNEEDGSDDTGMPQGDELFPERFRDRISNYSRCITPAWTAVTIPSKKAKKPDKQMYRHRFATTTDLDVTPKHLTSHFKVVEKEIWDAILHRRPEKVKELMEHKWRDNPILEKQDQVTALHVAAALGQCKIIKVLLSLGANPNTVDKYGLTPLHYAADFGCAQCVHFLISAGAQIDKDSYKQHIRTPLRYAVMMANSDCVAVLLGRGAIIFTQSTSPQDTLLYAAVTTGDVALCQVLLNAGANPKDSFEVLALASSKSLELLSCLVGAGADINLQGPPTIPETEKSKKAAKAPLGPGNTLLHNAVAADNMQMVDFLLSSLKASPNVIGDEGRSPLHLAVTPSTTPGVGSNSLLIAQALIAHGANLEMRNALGQTPLQVAVLWGRADMAKLLCSSGANIDTADEGGLSPWTETQKRDYINRSAPSTPRGGPWSGGDYRSVAEVVAFRRSEMRHQQNKEMELRQQLLKQHQQSTPPPPQQQQQQQPGVVKFSGAPAGVNGKGLPLLPGVLGMQQQQQIQQQQPMLPQLPATPNELVNNGQANAIELPPPGIDSRPVQEVHGDSFLPVQGATTTVPVRPTEERLELPA